MKLVHLFQIKVQVGAPIEIGPMPIGTRRIFSALGGSFEGERLRGELLQNGGEWLLDAGEGMGQVDVRLLLRTDDGAHIYMRYSGIMDFNEVVGHKLADGVSTDYGDNKFLTHVRLECADPEYAWLTTTLAVGEGRMHPDCVEYAIYELAHG
ncbi:MAG: hypothetical protein CL908_25965 [Deltaproteobacteria bacterium]|nr:hypothetical protein [Deltaproteobacteria bacterium]